MTNVVKAKIIRIGNSQGVRLPKIWLDQLNLGPEVEMAMQADKIVIRSVRRPRQDWEVHFAALAEAGDDRLLDTPVSTAFDQDEWEW
jgi:antitoxin MazE